MLLAIDTSAGTAVALVADDGRVLAERSTDDTRRHAEVIGPYLDEVLREAGATATALRGVVVGIGPGPYTGLRVGIAAARAVALAAGVPLLPVPSHDAVALRLVEGGVAAGRFAVVTDARRREAAVTVYSAALPLPQVVEPAHLVLRAGWMPPEGVVAHEVLEIPAAPLAHVALARLAAALPFAAPDPLYLRAPDVTLSSPKRVTS
ncbi:tRNA (adenosine(37)-N6)-threonylcarbamoyltransferase complex dimerization subunit type 1 TsaB [Microcella frigidaquae]|uniref:tRNA threonylcarbamoyl adenosine modification protein YeaZ n=1 Tax=Microcella frigidaquae TaxID=424758 RepID=A0A840XPA2_9MICO|nr:tRNA (adenosine(37)-N6)-threonylcarbamoyltransferase complex dimerization subunit type 1 TsaB [Microcella frigidaquae]MBB5617749.1 tRNA threonylcarbamoyl adenosine modification protein YeaZ [Microcella frigidaquae]NHN45536.1 tRNA (adenosine(37)-N6)-threonylcarbamoyltransferase complex dimerization subunit type 1 TsaB [Microcella frigidaquae]